MKYKAQQIRILAGSLSLLLLSFTLYLDDGELFTSRISQQLKAYLSEMPAEKVYLHIDKPFYKPGDELWFKAWVVDGTNHEASQISEILYVELINPKGNVEKSLNLPVASGWTNGDFTITESMPGGLYKIRAYTNWMKNFDEAYFFEKEFQIQKVLFPRLLMKLDFEKEAYGGGDKVAATLSVRTPDDKPLAGAHPRFIASLQGNKFFESSCAGNNEGESIIEFYLPDSLSTNDGLLNILIQYEGNTESISRSIPIVLNNIDLQFFPEGGDLVKKVPARIGFKALDEFGKPADIDGIVYNYSGDSICSFSSYHQGMGVFDLTAADENYYATITRPKDISQKYPLPKVLHTGYSLNVTGAQENGSEMIRIKIYSPRREEAALIGHIRGKVVYSQEIGLKKGMNHFEVETARFPAGVLQLTLFDSYHVPRCERLLFVSPKNCLNITIESSKKEYLPREEVELTIYTHDKDSMPVPANISLAVINDKVVSFADDKQDNIVSFLLLNNDLRGEVEEPAFYFDPLEEKADSAMDILLMTQGWRRFTWKTITEGSYHAGYLPERATTVTGKVVDRKTGQPVQAEVSLMEISEQRRFAKLETNSDGRFVFLNVNPYAQNKILASAQGKNPESILVLIDEGGNISNRGISASLTDEDLLPVIIREKVKEAALPAADYHDNEAGAEDQDAVMVPDLMALEECVVVGYGVQKKSDVTGSIVSVAADELMNIANIEQALQGRAAGVMVYQHAAGTPGEAANIRIRGLSAIDADEPLYVVDGQAMTDLPDSKISPLGYLNPEDISSIEILKDVSATAIYGSRGANGVILITTKRHGHGQLNQRIKQPKPRHQVKDLPPRQFSRVREFYTPKYDRDNVVEERTDFRSTIYWNPSIETGRDGKTTIRFFNSDEITTFRAIAEGIGPKGLTGRRESTYFVRLPFAIETRIPAYLCFGDTANISILLKNNTGNVLRGSLKLNIPDHLQVIEILPENIELKPNEIKTLGLVCRIGNVAGKSELAISFHAEGLSDAVRQEIEVQPKGFPVGISLSGNETEKNFSFTISDPLDGSLSAVFTAYPNVTSDLMSGIESILREPYGCFEQTSSSTYPNIMVLDYLRETGTSNPSVYKKAMELIERGYERLVSYETITKGYEWFGHAPAHESLTAYGLMEFTDMKKVFPDVNDNMIRRTVNWLNSRRDGKGNFEMDAKALDSFGRASQKVSNAYIVYSLSEAGINDIAIEYDLALKEAFSSGDPYRICLLANAGFNLGENDDGEKLLSVMQHKLEKTSFENLSIDHSITRSYGKSLQIETASLYLMAQLKSDAVSETDIAKTVNYLINSRSYGGFGSTQATVLALKSLTGFAKHSKQAQSSGTISIHINGEPAWEESYAKGESAEISSDQLSACLKKGENYLTISFTGTDQALPYSFDASWTSLTPATSEHSRIDLKTGITQNMLKIGETSRLSIELINKTREGQPMTVALIGIPAGMSAQPWQLKELQEKGVFDYYEVRKNYLVLYYRQMKPSEKKQINLDLKAEVAGNYTAPSSSAYLYYTSEHKTWVAGTQVSIVR